MTHLNLFVVREFTHDGQQRQDWMRVGVAFPHKSGSGLNIQLHAIPTDGRLVALPPESKEPQSAG